MTTPTPELVALLELSERATVGPWSIGRMLNPANAPALIGDEDSVLAIFPGDWNHCTYNKQDAEFIAGLVNWFRETHATADGFVSPMKAIADDLRDGTFRGGGPFMDASAAPMVGAELYLETHKGKKG